MRQTNQIARVVRLVAVERLPFRIALASGVALAAVAAVSLAYAAGTGLPTQDTDSIALSYAGATVNDGPAIAYTNPAGMVLIKGNEIEGDLNFYDINSHFSGQDTTSPGTTAGGATTENHFLEATLIPSTFAVNSLPLGIKFGLTVTTPNGGRIKYPNNFVGRYQGTEALLTEVQAGFMLAVPITDSLSIGGGPILDYFQNYVSLDQNEGALNSATSGGNGAEGRFRSSSYSLGYDVGAMYQFSPDSRVGLNYHSKITHDFKGTETIGLGSLPQTLGPLGMITNALGLPSLLPPYASPATDKFIFPQTVSFGFYQRLNKQLDVMVSAQWTDWQQAGDLLIADQSTNSYTGGIIYTPFHYRNTWTVGVGADYYPAAVPKLKLMAGVGYDETPVRAAYRNDLLPDNNRFMVSVGAAYQVLPNMTAKVAYAHYFIAPTAIMQTRQSLSSSGPTATSAGTLNGEYNLSANVFSSGVDLRF